MKKYALAAAAVFAASAGANAASLDYSFVSNTEGSYGTVERFWNDNRQDTFSAEALSNYAPGATAQATADAEKAAVAANGGKAVTDLYGTKEGLGVASDRAETEGNRIANNEALFLTFNNETNRIDRLLSLTFYEEDFGDETFKIYDFDGNELYSGSVNVKGTDGDYLTVDLFDGAGNAGLAGTQFILAITAESKANVKRGLRLAGVSGNIADSGVSAVPLPASALLLLTGLSGLAFSARRNKRA